MTVFLAVMVEEHCKENLHANSKSESELGKTSWHLQ
jgi:hypothetical protein